MTARQRPDLTTRRFASNAEADRQDAEYWRRMPAPDRVLRAWRLSVQQWQLLGRQPEQGQFGGVAVDYIGRDAFIRNKRATGRSKDLGDIEGL